MNKSKLPAIRMGAKPEGMKFKPSESARARFDKSISMAAKSNTQGEIEILGEIGESFWTDNFTTAKMVKDQLKVLAGDPVLVTINSPGGDAFEGIAIYNLLREYSGKVTVNVIGMAASAASIIAMAGDTVKMGEAAFLMIHSAWGVVMGNENDMREMADVLDAIDQSVAGVYASRSGLPKADIIALMKKETWMTAQQAVDQGFADVAIAEKKAKAAATKSISARAPVVSLGAFAGMARPAVQMSTQSPGAAGIKPKGNIMSKTVAEQISAFEAKRQASAARMTDIMSAAADKGETLDEAATQEYDTLAGEVKAVDAHIVRLKAHEVTMLATAVPITAAVGADPAAASAARAGVANSGIISVKANVEKGIAFTRYVKSMIAGMGNPQLALMHAQSQKGWKDTTPQVEKVLMSAVAGGDTTTAGWASELVYNENLVNEFIELLRPQTILGKMTGLTRVPFNVRMGSQTSGSSANWVGQGKSIPVSKLGTSEVTLGIAKAAGLVVLTEELVRSSSPAAELLVRNDLIKTIAEFLDVRFIDPNYAGVANVNPASVTYAVGGNQPTGTNYAALSTDVQTLFNTFITNNLDPTGAVWIMPPTRALAISMMMNALSQPYFPGLTMAGGTWFGMPVITSMSANVTASPDAGNLIVLAKQDDILLADDGQITIDASREATIEQSDAPVGDAAAGTAQTQNMVSMFQSNAVAIRAIRYINWAKRRTTAVAFIHAALYA
ncbi:MAG: head maturation protease, ClpP-related [Burkholderiales bacterium]